MWVGPAQWAPVRSRPGGAPRRAQSRGLASASRAATARSRSRRSWGGRIAFVWTRPDGSRAGAVLTPAGAQPGVDYFVKALPDGGAIAARGLWSGRARPWRCSGSRPTARWCADLIEPPTREMDAAASAVRFRAPDEVLVAYANERGFRIERFEVKAR